MRRWFFQNIGLKLLALVIAFALWVYVGSRQVLDRKVVLGLELRDIPEGMTLDSDVRTSIPVVLAGRKDSVLEIDPEELKAVVSLRGPEPGQKEVVVHPRVQPLPSGVTASVSGLTVHLVPLNVPKSKKKKRTSK